MRRVFAAAAFLVSFSSSAQHYYKDIIGTKETSAMIKAYQANKVSRVVLTSYDGSNTRSDDFFVEQQFSPVNQILKTITRSGAEHESSLVSVIDNNGNVVKTIDSSSILVSTTTYTYDPTGRLVSVFSSSLDSSKKTSESEQHLWQYDNGT